MFGFGKQEYEVFTIDPHTKARTTVCKGDLKMVQEKQRELRGAHKLAFIKKA